MEPAFGHSLQLTVRRRAPLWHIGAGWAALGGALAAGALRDPVVATAPPLGGLLTLALVWVLADLLLGAVWEVVACQREDEARPRAPAWDDAGQPLRWLPYAQPGSPAWQLAARLAGQRTVRGSQSDDPPGSPCGNSRRWFASPPSPVSVAAPHPPAPSPRGGEGERSPSPLAERGSGGEVCATILMPCWCAAAHGDPLVTTVGALGLAVMAAVFLGPSVTALVAAFIGLAWTTAGVSSGQGQGPVKAHSTGVAALHAVGIFGIPWLVGAAVAGGVSFLTGLIGVCLTVVCVGVFSSPFRVRLVFCGQLAMVSLLVAVHQPLAAAVATVALTAQWALASAGGLSADRLRQAVQPFILIGLIVAVVAVGA